MTDTRLEKQRGASERSRFSRYLRYSLTDALPRTLVFTIIMVLYTYFSDNPHPVSDGSDWDIRYIHTCLETSGALVLILAAIIPMFELYKLKRRRGLDLFFSLPVTRMQMAAAHYLSGFIQLLFAGGVLFLFSTLRLIRFADELWLIYVIPYFVIVMLFAWMNYTLSCFFFGEGNSIFDGVILVAFWYFSPIAVLLGLSVGFTFTKLYRLADDFLSAVGLRTGLYDHLTGLETLIQSGEQTSFKAKQLFFIEFAHVFWIAVSIILTVMYFIRFKSYRAERAGGLSDSPFAYKALIPVYSLSLAFAFSNDGFFGGSGGISLIVATIVGILTAVGYMVYRRSVRLRIPDIAWIAISVAIALF